MHRIFPAAAAALAAIAAGCARAPDRVEASYVSPVLYQQLTCDQLGIEATRVSNRAAQLTGDQRGQRTTDSVVTAVGVVVFWPALFFIGGDDSTTAELARIKGEMQAIQDSSLAKGCSIQFHQAPPAPAPAVGTAPA